MVSILVAAVEVVTITFIIAEHPSTRRFRLRRITFPMVAGHPDGGEIPSGGPYRLRITSPLVLGSEIYQFIILHTGREGVDAHYRQIVRGMSTFPV